MFTHFPFVADSLFTDKCKVFYYGANEFAKWLAVSSNNNIKSYNTTLNGETVYCEELTDTSETGRLLYYLFNNQALHADTITFYGDVLISNSNHQVSITIEQEPNNKIQKIYSSPQWQYFAITIPYQKPTLHDRSVPLISIEVDGKSKGKVYFNHVGMLLDGKPIDEQCPLPPANDDHEFDISSKFAFKSRQLTDKDVERLKTICLMWGFLKYYHPKVRIGTYDWNFQLFRILASTLYAKTDNKFINDLCRWIPDIQNLNIEGNDHNKDSIVSEIQMEWIDLKFLDKKLYSKMKTIRKLERSDEAYSFGYYDEQKNALLTWFKNETAYDSIQPTDDGYRMLALFRFWNMMYYFHPYMSQKEKRWLDLLPQYIRLFAQAYDREDFDEACVRLTCELEDTHSEFYGFKTNVVAKKMWKSAYLPIRVKLANNKLIITGFDSKEIEQSGLKLGDMIVKVNGKSIADIRRERAVYSNFSSESRDQYADAYASFNGDHVRYTIERGHKLIDLDITCKNEYWKSMIEQDVNTVKILKDSIKYVNLTVVSHNQLVNALQSAKQLKGIIFDMRGYPKDPDCSKVLSQFLYPHKKALFYYSYPDMKHPGIFRKNSLYQYFGEENPDFYKGKVAVLVNGLTMSGAEHIATVIGNSPSGIVIGDTTGGVYGNVVYVPFACGNSMRYTGRGAYWFDNTCTYPDGTKINYYIKPTSEDAEKEVDSALQFTLRILGQ